MLSLLLAVPATATDFCAGGVLDQGAPIGQTGPDLVITNMTCTVDGTHAPYNFHNVYVFGSGAGVGKLVFNNATMHFYAANILIQNQGVLQATGIGGGKTLTIHLYGAATSGSGVTCKKMDNGNVVDDATCGVPNSAPDVWDSNKLNTQYPSSCTKTSQLNPPTRLPGGVDDCFYQYGGFDSGDIKGAYFGHKVLAVSYGGSLLLSGIKGAQGGNDADPSVTGSSWTRLNATLKGGEPSLQVSSMPTDWEKDDYIVVTATDYLPGHAEQLQIAGVSGNTVTLENGKVVNPHWGQAYSLMDVPCNNPMGSLDCQYGPNLLPGQTKDDRNIDTRAAVGLLTRSIRIVSDGEAAGSSFDGYYGGHTIARQGFLAFQVQGVEFYQLGQGGAKGHYAVHFHMARLVPQDTYVKDSSMWDSMTRWITIHATQGVSLLRNVGYKSIGHGFYLEDGTETDNVINTNLGVFARAAVDNEQNDRKVPGIFAAPGLTGSDNPPYHSDWEHPSVFWIMNGWNDFEYNYAASAGTCGVCYWLLPGGISGPSQYEFFEGYAGQQVVKFITLNDKPVAIDRSGISPLKKFVGNACSTAMTSLLNIGSTTRCNGVSNSGNPSELQAITNTSAPPPGPMFSDPYYSYVGGLRNPTQCTGPDCTCTPGGTCPNVPCSGFGPGQANCVVTDIDRYTTSFNWAQKNFAAIWLRPWWFLFRDSAITDVQQGGLTFVTSGGYTRADAAQGYWSLMRNSVLVGETQPQTNGIPANPYASNGGPFNPSGLTCDSPQPPLVDFCVSKAQGISYPTESLSVNQKLFNIYDGPAFQEKNAYLDTRATKIGTADDTKCTTTPDGVQRTCSGFKWLYSLEIGLPSDPKSPDGTQSCYLPNAAIAWKQSNGFYYPPAFHSENLYFKNVDIRHFVIEPLFEFGTFKTYAPGVKKRYCTWRTDMFDNYTDVDRQTILNDDDGSLTGLLGDLGAQGTRETISVNEDSFFNAPTVTTECASDVHSAGAPTGPPATANTSPYEYVTTATIADCAINRAGCIQNPGTPQQWSAWGPECSAGSGPTACYGVPLYRQYLTDTEYGNFSRNPLTFHRPQIRMMGQSTGQRSTLTVNHGRYYIDDQVSRLAQQNAGFNQLNVYLGDHTYYTYFLFAKPTTQQTYTMFVGYGLDKPTVLSSIHQYRVGINDQNYQFTQKDGDAAFITKDYDDRPQNMGGTGLITVTTNLSAYQMEFDNDTPQFCQPRTYCSPDTTDSSKCVCNPDNPACNDDSCRWAVKEIDCPLNGCFGWGVTLPHNFLAGGIAKPPAPRKFTDDPNYMQNWATPFKYVDSGVSGAQCHYGTSGY